MLCILAKIDSASRKRLLELQQLTNRFGIPIRHLHGHITVASPVKVGEIAALHREILSE